MKDFRELETEIKKASDKFTNIESINEFRIKFLGKNFYFNYHIYKS